MLYFISVNNFSKKKYRYGLNFEVQDDTVNFLMSENQDVYESLFNTILSPQSDLKGQIYFGKYELIHMDEKIRSRFIYDKLEILTDNTFYNQHLSVYNYFKENWMINHLNTKNFDNYLHAFIQEIKISNWIHKLIKDLTTEQKVILKLALTLFNHKKYLLINQHLDFQKMNWTTINNFLTYLTKKGVTVLWFCKSHEMVVPENFNVINLDNLKYDCLNQKFIVNDETLLARKFSLTFLKWIKISSNLFYQSNVWISLLYLVMTIAMIGLGLFFANKPVTIFEQNFGILKTDYDCLFIGIVFLILSLIFTALYFFYFYKKDRSYFCFLFFSGVPKSSINFLIYFIILIYNCSVILSSYIILLITYHSFDVLHLVKWVSSIYFPISFLFFNVSCCVIFTNTLKNNLLETKNTIENISVRKKSKIEREKHGKKI